MYESVQLLCPTPGAARGKLLLEIQTQTMQCRWEASSPLAGEGGPLAAAHVAVCQDRAGGTSHQRSDPWRTLLASNCSEESAGIRGCEEVFLMSFLEKWIDLTKPSPKGLKRQAGLEGCIPLPLVLGSLSEHL